MKIMNKSMWRREETSVSAGVCRGAGCWRPSAGRIPGQESEAGGAGRGIAQRGEERKKLKG